MSSSPFCNDSTSMSRMISISPTKNEVNFEIMPIYRKKNMKDKAKTKKIDMFDLDSAKFQEVEITKGRYDRTDKKFNDVYRGHEKIV